MPATSEFRNGKWRVVEGKGGAIVKNNKGTAVDGGGHQTKAAADKQARAINANSKG